MFTSILGAIWLFNVSKKQLSAPAVEHVTVLATKNFSLENRYANSFVNNVFKDNILLTFYYLSGHTFSHRSVDWSLVEKPAAFEFTLKKGQTFAFHDSILSKYAGKVAMTTNAHFTSLEGFKSDGYLVADGVCHLASLMDWAARDAGLTVEVPTSHDFAVIPDVPREYGVAIYDSPESKEESALQNLYITNNKDSDVTFRISYEGTKLSVAVVEK